MFIQSLGMTRVGLFTDNKVRMLEPVDNAIRNLKNAVIEFEIYDEVSVEPTDISFQEATQDASDEDARHGMMLAATMAGVAFGNSSVHIFHGMSYSVAGMVQDNCPDGYPPGHPLVPHGIWVVVNAPDAFRFTASTSSDGHLEGAKLLGANVRDIGTNEVGEALGENLEVMMQSTDMPNGISGVGYGHDDIEHLVEGAYVQQRLMNNAACEVTKNDLISMYSQAIRYW